MSSPRPVLVLVHGAWHLPTCWDPIRGPLESHGYEVVTPRLPSSGGDPVVPDMSADIKAIRDAVGAALDAGKDAVVVLHSYAGMPGGNALDGFDRESRMADGHSSHVRRLVYINAYLVVEGTQLNPRGTRDNMVPAMITDFEKGLVTADPALTRGMLFQDISSDEKLAELNATLVPHSIGVFWDTTTSAAWRRIPTTYVRCMGDMPSTVAATRSLLDTARASGQHRIDRVIERDVGHCPYLTQPGWTVETIRREAGEEV